LRQRERRMKRFLRSGRRLKTPLSWASILELANEIL
jgi:hypothetical protein